MRTESPRSGFPPFQSAEIGEDRASMKQKLSLIVRRWVAYFMIVALVGSIVGWAMTRDLIPSSARIATGAPNGVFHQLGARLAEAYEKRTEKLLEPVPTEGSVENLERLKSGDVDLAIFQGGAGSMAGLSGLAPLHPEMAHIVARTNREIDSVYDLEGKRIIIGPPGSGMRQSSEVILDHYGLTDRFVDLDSMYFAEMIDDPSVDAAIVTTGIFNVDLSQVLREKKFKLIPIESAAAIEAKRPFLFRSEIPRGLYHENPPIPANDVSTVSTHAYLVARPDAPLPFIQAVLESLYEEGISQEFPNLVAHNRALENSTIPLHPEARRYFNPPDDIGFLATILESLVATKELLVAFGAGGWLLWDRWRRLKESEKKIAIMRQKDHLDTFLDRTLEIERQQMRSHDVAELERFLEQVTNIKLKALEELTHEELRSDQTFAIFLAQCANLINKIQFRISRLSPPKRDGYS